MVLHVAYRSEMGQDYHDFYYTEVHFTFSENAEIMRCQGWQKTDSNPAHPTEPAGAEGRRMVEKPAEAEVIPEALAAFIAEVASAHRTETAPKNCAVCYRSAEADNQIRRHGELRRFCCPACRKVFETCPDAFP